MIWWEAQPTLQKTILDINLAFNEVCQKRQPLELNKAVSYLILATMLTLSDVNLRFKQSSLNYLWNTTKCQTAGYDIPFIQSIIFISSRCLVEHYPMWICFITAGRERRSVPLDVDAGWSVFPQWRFCVDLCSAHGTSLFSIKPHGDTILTKYMLKSKLN